MPFRLNAAVTGVETPPIAEAMSWLGDQDSGRPLLDLSQAAPNYPPARALQDEVARLAAEPSTSQFTDILGLPELRLSLARHMAADYGAEVGAREVAITAGCNQAYCLALMALAGPGDNAILPAPYYFNHRMWLDALGIEARHVQAGAAAPALADLAARIDAKTRAIVLCSPNNPTGANYPPDLLAEVFGLCEARGLALVIDETYKDFRLTPGPPHGLFSKPRWQDTFVQLYSFSKSFALMGYRVGSIVAGERLIGQVEKVMDCVAICAPRISQGAARFGLERLSAWAADKADAMRARGLALERAFAEPGLDYRLVSAGAVFAYVRHPFAGEAAGDVARRLAREHGLLGLPGSMFGPGQEAFLRLAFANVDAESCPEIVRRLTASQGPAGGQRAPA